MAGAAGISGGWCSLTLQPKPPTKVPTLGLCQRLMSKPICSGVRKWMSMCSVPMPRVFGDVMDDLLALVAHGHVGVEQPRLRPRRRRAMPRWYGGYQIR